MMSSGGCLKTTSLAIILRRSSVVSKTLKNLINGVRVPSEKSEISMDSARKRNLKLGTTSVKIQSIFNYFL